MRQWPGNGADLDFRGVIRGCTALVVAAPIIEGKLTEGVMGTEGHINNEKIAAFLKSEEGAAAKKLLFAFRLWCVVELHAALEAGIPVVIRAGRAAREGDAVKFDSGWDAHVMLENLAGMIDVERAECAVRADYDREMDAVRNGEGVETVNKRVAGAVIGGLSSAKRQILAVDAAVCGEPEALRALPDYRVKDTLYVAASGGRRAAVEELVARGVVDLASEAGPLSLAAMGGHHEVVTALLAAGASVDRAGYDGDTPLITAARHGHVEVVTALIAARANVDLAMNNAPTPLITAARHGHVEVVRLLVRAGADTTLGNDNGPPIRQICKDDDADKANEAKIKAILLSATPRAKCCVIT